MPLSRTARLTVLLATTVAIVVTSLLLLPYRTTTLLMDRRTGEMRVDGRLFLVRIHAGAPQGIAAEVGRYGTLAGPATTLVLQTNVCRFPWSAPVTGKGDGSRTADVFYALFTQAALLDTRARPLGEEDFARLMAERVAIWNSDLPDRDAEGLHARIIAENKALYDKALGH